jgi:hypothetical protein
MSDSKEAAGSAPPIQRPFFFRRRRGRLDWKKLQRVNLEKVVTEVDIDTLQDNVEHITFADIGEDGTSFLRSGGMLKY